MKKIIITGGGTAGHALPVIEIGKILNKNRRVKLIYVGSCGGIEKKLAIKSCIPFWGIITGKRRQYFSLLNFVDLIKIFFGLIQSFILFIVFKPDIIFAKGGYVTFPIVFWAKALNKTIIVHESDAVMGKANIYAAKKAKKICFGFPIKYFFQYNNLKFSIDKLIYTGIPLRNEFNTIDSENKQNKNNLLIMGGSQGSEKINNLVLEMLPEIVKKFNVYHIVGENNYKKIQAKTKSFSNYFLYGYTNDLPLLLKKADLVVSRAGASTLAEISAMRKPAIMIPLSSASGNHQYINAKIYQESNAGILITEKNLTANSLQDIINRLADDKELRNLIGHHAGEFFIKDSASIIADIIYEEKTK